MTPHRSAEYIQENIVYSRTERQLESYAVDHIGALNISSALRHDAKNYFYSSAITIADALNGIRCHYYTWATVKLYYAAFYSVRALLALDGYAIFYIRHKPRIVRARAGAMIKAPRGRRRSATTHGLVMESFKATNPSHYLLSQDIANENPLDWLHDRRVDANYRCAKFPEPNLPKHLAMLSNNTPRQLTAAYLDSFGISYEFDPDHAILAFPLKAAQIVKEDLKSSGNYDLPATEIRHIKRCFRDQHGALSKLLAIFEA